MGTLLFKEDYGGNSKNDNVYATERPASLSEVSYTFKANGKIENGEYGRYVLRKETKFDNGWDKYNYIGDHTHPANIQQGYLFEVDAAAGTEKIFYKQKLDVVLCKETDMTVSFWIANINREQTDDNTFPNLTFNINCYNSSGDNIYSVSEGTGKISKMHGGRESTQHDPTIDPTDWQRKSFTVKLPQATEKVDVTIKNNTNTTTGNDFALDDFEIKICPPPANISAQSGDKNIVTKDFCTSESSTITINGECPDPNGTYGSNAVGMWQYSEDGGKNWIDIRTDASTIIDSTLVKGNEATMRLDGTTWKSTLPIEVKTSNNAVTDKNYKFRWIVAATAANFDKICCSTISNSFNVNVKAVPAILKSDVVSACLGVTAHLWAVNQSATSNSYTYSWDDGSNTSEITVTPLERISRYYVTVTAENGNGCSAKKSIDVKTEVPQITDIYVGDFVWSGQVSTDWNDPKNWFECVDPANGKYRIPTTPPLPSSNVFIGRYLSCSGAYDVVVDPNVSATAHDVTLRGDVTLTISDNAQISVAGDVNVNILNSGTNPWVNKPSSTVTFNGNEQQTITNLTDFANITFNNTTSGTTPSIVFGSNASGTMAPADISISSTATFTDGVVAVNSATFGEDATAVSGSTDTGKGMGINSHIVGDVTKEVADGTTVSDFTFPVGSGSTYGGITADLSGDATVGYNFNHDGYSTNEMPRWWSLGASSEFNNVNNREFWEIDGTLTDATITWDGGNRQHDTNTPWDNDALGVAFWDGTHWVNLNGSSTAANGNAGTGSIGPISSIGSTGFLTLGSTNPNIVLPIELVSLTATCESSSAVLRWTTATETNNDYFVVERSENAIDFSEIARVDGAGTSITSHDYKYIDHYMAGGDNYYRLMQVDYNGGSSVSNVVAANCVEEVGEPMVMVYPNPFDDEITIVLQNFSNREAQIEVYDVFGRLVKLENVVSTFN
ncbi:MAG: hypothetical protein HUK15_07660, partial [Bacteroidales bacterium]|nr:hypothetical protein [Bacteroidales bacterium]